LGGLNIDEVIGLKLGVAKLGTALVGPFLTGSVTKPPSAYALVSLVTSPPEDNLLE
jgi:hypothetical protein